MTLSKYIEDYENLLDEKLTKAMEKDTINYNEILMINAEMFAIESIKTAIENGVIEGVN